MINGDEVAGGSAEADSLSFGLVASTQIEVAQFAPPPALAPFVTQIYHFRCEETRIRDTLPAALGHLIFYLRGRGSIRFEDGKTYATTPAALFGPGMAHGAFDLEGPFEHVGFALSPLGFVALTGKHAFDYSDRLVDAASLFGPAITDLALDFQRDRAEGTLSVRHMVERAAIFLQRFARPVPPSHIVLIQTVSQWLSSEFDPDVEQLFAQIDKPRSTATRIIRNYFGASPKQLTRKYRALRAAIVLVDPEASVELKAKVESLFYDQSHLIREIRHFTGRTPGGLDSDDSKILRIWLSKDNLRQLEAYPG